MTPSYPQIKKRRRKTEEMAVGRNQLLFIFLGWENFWNGIAGFDSSTFIDLSLSLAPPTSNRPVTLTVPWSDHDGLLQLSLTTTNSKYCGAHSNENMISRSCQVPFNEKLKAKLCESGTLHHIKTREKCLTFPQDMVSSDDGDGTHEKDLYASESPEEVTPDSQILSKKKYSWSKDNSVKLGQTNYIKNTKLDNFCLSTLNIHAQKRMEPQNTSSNAQAPLDIAFKKDCEVNFETPDIQKRKFQSDSQETGDIIWKRKAFQSNIFKDKHHLNPTDVSHLPNISSQVRDKNVIPDDFHRLKGISKQNPMNLSQHELKKFFTLGETQALSSNPHKLQGMHFFYEFKSKPKPNNCELKFIKEIQKGKSNEVNEKAFNKLRFDWRVFQKKGWTIYHENKRHELICKWIGGQNYQTISDDEIKIKLYILKTGFVSRSTQRIRSFKEDLHDRKASQKKREILLKNSIKILFENKDKWIPYWKSNVDSSIRLDLSGENKRSRERIWKIFSTVLFYSDMIDTICEMLRIDANIPKIKLIELSANHFNEKKLTEFFDDEKISLKRKCSGKILNGYIDRKRYRISNLVWKYLCFIIRISHRPELQSYSLLIRGPLSTQFKSFFNDLFCYSIINFNDFILYYHKEAK